MDKKLRVFRKTVAAVVWFFFGSVSYKPPGFCTLSWKGFKAGVRYGGRGIGKLKRSRPALYRALQIILPVLLLAGAGLWYYVGSRPQPARLRVTVRAPALKPMVKGARPAPLYVRFSGSAARLEKVQKFLTEGIVLKPDMPGQWKWSRDDELMFTPAEDWPAGTGYEIELEKRLFPEHVLLQTYRLSFTTPSFSVRIASCTFYIDPRDESLKQVAATIAFSHAVDPATFDGRVTLRPCKVDPDIPSFQDREYRVDITYDDFYGKAYILSEPLPMPEDDVMMRLEVDKGVACASKGRSSPGSISSQVRIPGITNYVRINSITQTMVRNDEYRLEQVLIVSSRGKARGTDLQKHLEAWLLPRDLPPSPGIKGQRNYYWRNPSMVGPEVLAKSVRLATEPLPSEHDYEEITSFRIKADTGRYLYLKINKGAPFYGRYNLSKDFTAIVRVRAFPKQLEIMHEGIILASSGEKKVSLMSQGVAAVQFRIGRVQPDQLNHLVSQSNGYLNDLRFDSRNFGEENIVENYYETRTLVRREPGEPNYFSFDFSGYLRPKAGGRLKHGIFFLEAREWDPQNKHAFGKRAKRMIMVSDLGLLVKKGTGDRHDLFVQSLRSGLPVAGARVEVLGKNGIPVLSTITDQSGQASLQSLGSFKDEKRATVFLVTRGDDLSFMPVEAPGRWLNYSRFDVGGVHGAADPEKIDAYLFSSRGIYRPGDEFNIGMIVKSGDWRISLAGTPLEAAVIDARGLEIYKKKFKLPASGFEELAYKTESTSPTGTYQVNLYTVEKDRRHHHIAATTVKVEEFLPDRLSITALFPGVKGRGWVSPDSLRGVVTLKNLFGSPAAGNRVAATMSLSPGRMWFHAYRDFTFADPLTHGKSFSERLPEQTTDEQGQAVFEFGLDRFEAATYTLRFMADGFEKEGGRNVSAEAQVLVSPLSFLLGTRADGDLSYIYKDSKRTLTVIAVSPELKKTAVKDIVFEINEIRHVSVLTRQPNGTYVYKSVRKTVPVSSAARIVTAAGLDYVLPTDTPGEFELVIKQGDMVFSRRVYSVVGSGNLTRSLDKTAELEIKLNKQDYEPGEAIEVYVKAPYRGAGLITVERDRVYASQWFQARDNSFIEKIRLPRDLEGNGYITVSFVRAADSREVFMSPLSYGVAPFSVSRKNRMNEITIDMRNMGRSGEVFPVKYRTDKPARIVVFAVDEGILQVADYHTPDPLAHFFKKRALEVRTSQILDLILPEFSLLTSLTATGGGMGYKEIAKNLNPFKRKQHKPVVYWSGILDSDRKERTVSFTVPDYFNGTLRVMAVAVSQDAVGTFEEKVIVKNPYIISPNVPMFAAPRDSFQVTVTVTNGVDGSGAQSPVVMEVTGSSHLKVYDGKRKLKIDEDRDTTLTFFVTACNLPGGATLTFRASGPKETTTLAAYLSVRPAQPYQTRVTTGVVERGAAEVETPRVLYREFRVLNSSLSFLPLGLSKGLKTYLDRFPYGCTEQVVSQAFPYLFLKDVNGFGITDTMAKEKIGYALKVLQARQNGEGKFGVWAANDYTSDFITVYGMHFLTECVKAGYYVSDILHNKAILALKEIAGQKQTTLRDLRVQAYAVYLLTLNEIVTTNYIAALEKVLKEGHEEWKSDIAGAYLAAAYLIMKQERPANSILSKAVRSQLKPKEPWHFCNGFIQHAQLLYLVAEHAPGRLKDVSDRIISRLAAYLGEGGYSTITSAYTIMALSSYARVTGTAAEGKVSLTQVLRDKNRQTLQIPEGVFPTVNFSENAARLVIDSKEKVPLFYQVVQGGFNTALPAERVSEGIELFREFTDKNGNPAGTVSLGDEVTVHLKFRSLTNRDLLNIAVVDLLPAGLEAVPTSVREHAGGSWYPEFTDIREDRLVIFGTVSPAMKEYVYKVRAINRGTFTVPPIYGESMYDRNIYGFSPQKPIVVE